MKNSASDRHQCTRTMPTTGFKRLLSVLKTKIDCSKNFPVPFILFLVYLSIRSCNASTATTSIANYVPSLAHIPHTYGNAPHECGSIDIRNDCSSFDVLQNCTVVKGYLMIVLLPKDKYLNNGNDTCKYNEIRFPLLREVTDYIIMFHVKGLTTIRDMFPNLTVIRGRRLFLNYAIGITEMPHLETLEFRSLVAIQRGHVFIGSSPKLCQLEKINWKRLTLTAGDNHIFPMAPETCKQKAICKGCPYSNCWSTMVCQKFENDNIVNLALDNSTSSSTQHCHPECLGGCYNTTNAGCAVCRGLTDHGVCVDKCPSNKFMHEHSQRCYTRDECINEMRLLAHDGLCLSHCPIGFTSNRKGSCIPCASNDGCINVCQPEPYSEDLIVIYNLADADHLSSCDVINGTLMITIRNKVNENDLAAKLKNLREIKGYLRVFRSPYLTSLQFLKNLRKIGGTPSESAHYSLIVYDNKNLRELWEPQHLELEHGGMFIHLNNRLCNHVLMEFSEKVKHNHLMDSVQTSDQETLCGPVKLLLDIQVLSHHELLFSWHEDQTEDEIEIMYRPVAKDEIFNSETELDTPICQRIKWHRELIFEKDLQSNGTHFSYKVDGLKQNTKYACLVKTFGSSYKQNARSDMVFMTTKSDVPPPPIIRVVKKTDNSMKFNLQAPNNSMDYMIKYYLLEVYKKPDDIHYLDKRNYCLQPAYLTTDLLTEAYSDSVYDEDYDDCCARVEDDNEDERFMMNMNAEFSCSLDRKKNCLTEKTALDMEKPVINLRLPSNETTHELHHLERFRLYVIMVKACNEIGCSSFGMHSERTNYTTAGDLVGDLEGCHKPDSNEYRVYFTEPKQPNGVIVSYVVHFRLYIPDAEHYQSHIGCVTRLEHQKSMFVFIRHINMTLNQVAVRAHSLAGDAITSWLNITPCHGPFPAETKLAGFDKNIAQTASHPTHGVNIFLVFFIIGCVGTALWVCYKQRYWRRIPELRQFLPFNQTREIVRSWVDRNESTSTEDRQILVDNYETVRFQNRHDDDDDNNTTCSSISE